MATFSPNAVRCRLFAWQTKFGEIDPCREVDPSPQSIFFFFSNTVINFADFVAF